MEDVVEITTSTRGTSVPIQTNFAKFLNKTLSENWTKWLKFLKPGRIHRTKVIDPGSP
jgi:hypothetical protein